MSTPIRIGTRESALAMWQAEYVQSLLTQAYPDHQFTINGMTTHGDKDQLKPLSQFGTKNIFTKELDSALLDGSVDIVVHCVKDLATTLPDGIKFCAILQRGPVDDAVLLNPKHYDLAKSLSLNPNIQSKGPSQLLATLPEGSIIGTSALRRQATLSRYHPHLQFKDIRGNLNTRINKLDSGNYDAIILATIGLERLGLGNRINERLDIDTYQYAVGQGALAIVCREDDNEIADLIHSVLHNNISSCECKVERGLLYGLQGGCKVPIAIDTKHLRTTKTDALKFIEKTKAIISQTIKDIDTSKDRIIISTNSLEEVTCAEKSEQTTILYLSRVTVMNLNGTKIIECPIAFEIEESDTKKQVSEQHAWDTGILLSKYMLQLGAMRILEEVRA